jgi:hypothetical protein
MLVVCAYLLCQIGIEMPIALSILPKFWILYQLKKRQRLSYLERWIVRVLRSMPYGIGEELPDWPTLGFLESMYDDEPLPRLSPSDIVFAVAAGDSCWGVDSYYARSWSVVRHDDGSYKYMFSVRTSE